MHCNLNMQPGKNKSLDRYARPRRFGVFQVFLSYWQDHLGNAVAVFLNLVRRNLLMRNKVSFTLSLFVLYAC